MSYKLSLSLIFILSTLFVRLIAEGPKDPGLIEHVEPNIDAIKGLICYQCRSITSELTPLCDKALFRLTTPEEKNNMSLQCPHYQGAYCFTKVIKRGKHKETLRGCSGSTDRNGNLMKVGCMTTEKEVLCLCEKKFCNRADIDEKYLSQKQFSLIFALITIILNSKIYLI